MKNYAHQMALKVSFEMPNQYILLMKIHFGNIKPTTEHPGNSVTNISTKVGNSLALMFRHYAKYFRGLSMKGHNSIAGTNRLSLLFI